MKVSKLFFFIICTIMISGCSDPIETLIPPSLVHGSLQGFNIQMEMSKDGNRLDGEAIVPHDIKRDQIKPTLLAALKGMKQEHPKYDWIILYLYAGGNSKTGGVSPGRAEYKGGKITINYEIPSAEQIEIQKKVVEETPGSNPRSIPELLSKEEFTKAAKIEFLYHSNHSRLNDRAKALAAVSKKMNISTDKVTEYREKLGYYYGMAWGQEVIQ